MNKLNKELNNYRVTYFEQYIDDYGTIRERNRDEIISEKSIGFYKEAMNGKSFGGEYIKVHSITQI